MGCFFSPKKYIEEKIEECEIYLALSKINIKKFKQAFFNLNDGNFINEKSLQKALITLDLAYSDLAVVYVVYPFFQSFTYFAEIYEKVPFLKEKNF